MCVPEVGAVIKIGVLPTSFPSMKVIAFDGSAREGESSDIEIGLPHAVEPKGKHRVQFGILGITATTIGFLGA